MNNLISIIISANDNASSVIKNVTGTLDGISDKITRAGVAMTAATAVITAGLGASVHQAMQFDEAMTNVGAVLGKSAEEMRDLNAEVLRIGGAARAGPQAAAQAFYDIVGGVADASTHIAILNAAIATSEAGAAELAGTTSALIAVMNSYSFAADKASFASDVLTQTVGMGVGSMEELAAAIPQVAGLASQAGISFDDLGASIAFLSTKGFSFSQSATQIRAAIVALLTPNAKMLELFQAAGIESGSAAIQAHGLAGAYDLISRAANGSQDELARAVGSVEALNAVMALGQEGFTDFANTFREGVNGATEAARALQRESAAFQLDLLKSALSELAISIGSALLPALNKIVGAITPIVRAVTDWLREHPRLTTVIVGFAAALTTVGPLLIGIGAALKGATLATTGLSAALKVLPMLLGLLTSPIALVVGGLTLLATLLGVDVLGGIRAVGDAIGVFQARLEENSGDIIKTLRSMFLADEDGSNVFSTILEGFGMAREQAQEWGATIGRVATQIIDAVQGVVAAFNGDLMGAMQHFTEAGIDEQLSYRLITVFSKIGDAVRTFITDFQITLSLIPFYAGYYFGMIWSRVQPVVQPLMDWITGDGEDSLNGAIASVADWIDQNIVRQLQGIWALVQPALQDIVDWFNNDLQTAIQNVASWVDTNIVTPLRDIWTTVQPHLESIVGWFEERFQDISTFIAPVLEEFDKWLTTIRTIWQLLGIVGDVAEARINPKPPTTDPRGKHPPLSDALGNIIGGGGGGVISRMDFGGFRAGGGSVMANVLYGINERGAEAFIPSTDGAIVSNEQLRAAMGGRTINIHEGAVVIHVHDGDPEKVEEAVWKALEELGN